MATPWLEEGRARGGNSSSIRKSNNRYGSVDESDLSYDNTDSDNLSNKS